MAKTYINTVKYMIKSKFEINGIVDKHDIIGAIFGQSEGLLGTDLDLRELQKNGRIGRIEINANNDLGKTLGELTVPSSMDMVETSILAASIESVDKVGPCDSKFDILEIEDTRELKRKNITERAKELLQKLSTGLPESQVLAEEVRDKIKVAELVEYGPDKIPAGPAVESSNEIIIAEGRADVLNLLKNNIDNVVGMDGSKINQTIIDLCNQKEVTVFIDGDRGGLLNLRKLQNLAKVDFVAQAPEGKEVEELVRKEIVAALRRKVPADHFGKEPYSSAPKEGGDSDSRYPSRYPKREYTPRREYNSPRREYTPRKSYSDRSPRESSPIENGPSSRNYGDSFGFPRERRPFNRFGDRNEKRNFAPRSFTPRNFESRPFEGQTTIPEEKASIEDLAKYSPILNELKNTLKARLYNAEQQLIEEIDVKDLVQNMIPEKNCETIVFDGIITPRLVEAAEKSNVKNLVGIKKGKITANDKVKTITIQ